MQALLSAQSASAAQQPACGVNVQVLLKVLQTSLVHVLPSLHCAFAVQQSGLGVLTHWPGVVDVSHVSVVHAFMSLH